jgi:hypothetical protein
MNSDQLPRTSFLTDVLRSHLRLLRVDYRLMSIHLTPFLVRFCITTAIHKALGILFPRPFRVDFAMTIFIMVCPKVTFEVWLRLT